METKTQKTKHNPHRNLEDQENIEVCLKCNRKECHGTIECVNRRKKEMKMECSK